MVATDDAPVFATAYPENIYSGVAYTPAFSPVVVIVYAGTNDSSFTTNQYKALLTAIRTLNGPYTLIIAVTPWNKTSLAANISGAVTALADPRCVYGGDATSVFTSTDLVDSIGHFNEGGAVKAAAWFVSLAQTQLNSFGIKMQAAGGAAGLSVSRAFGGY